LTTSGLIEELNACDLLKGKQNGSDLTEILVSTNIKLTVVGDGHEIMRFSFCIKRVTYAGSRDSMPRDIKALKKQPWE
jgi:hypothetical protein